MLTFRPDAEGAVGVFLAHASILGLSSAAPELRRVAIEGVVPEVDGGRFAIKRAVGESVMVEADIHADGHEAIRAMLLHRPAASAAWMEQEMTSIGNDRWRADFRVNSLEPYVYTVQAWLDAFQTWLRDTTKKANTEQNISVELAMGAELAHLAADRARGEDGLRLLEFADALANAAQGDTAGGMRIASDPAIGALMARHADRAGASTYEKELGVIVDREKARFSAWYEIFPRSCTADPARPGTFRDCMDKLDYIAGMGFDVLYLPPIHPIGYAHRKGKDNTTNAGPNDPGSPWAIGSAEGGHKAIHPQLGTPADFKELMARARAAGLEIALDLAFQCAPDHPYVKEHQEWFRMRPDGTVQYAENPPKKYEDIFPFDFESGHALELCEELKQVTLYWIEQGVRIFRVDNPHTKPFGFWEWMIGEVKREHPETIFLAEAFTRPKVMYRLAKLGFTQSYTYFTWKNTKAEITQYFTELAQTPVREFFRMNLWPNTPDILNEYLQTGGRPAFEARLVLAATLGANYGIYGGAFELCENEPLKPGSEEYLHSEKYEIRARDLGRPDSLRGLIARVNGIRREHPALHGDWSLRFHPADNERLIAYSKATEDRSDIILTVVNLNPHNTESGFIDVPLQQFGLPIDRPYEVQDLLSGASYQWRGTKNYIELNPAKMPAHIFAVRR